MKKFYSFILLVCLINSYLSAHNKINGWVDSLQNIGARNTPCPNFVEGVKDCKISLDGEWWFNPDPDFLFEKEHNVEGNNGWKKIEVPSEWGLRGFQVNKGSYAGYFRRFILPKDWDKKRVLIHFEAISSECKLFLNGKEVGSFMSSMLPFEFEVTNYLVQGVNSISLYVKSESLADQISGISHYAKHQVGGIIRQIYIGVLPSTYIEDVYVNYSISKNLKKANLDFFALLNSKECRKHDIEIEILKKGIYLCNEEEFQTDSIVLKKKIRVDKNIINVNLGDLYNLELWHPESPFLYELRCKLYTENKLSEVITKNIGFKKIEIQGNVTYLNNVPIKLKGVALHEVNPYEGRAVKDSMQVFRDVLLFRKANCNYIRTAHYPKSSYFYDLCDKLGILVENEAPVCWLGDNANKPDIAELIVSNFVALVKRDRMHPSVFCWSIANESRWNNVFSSCLKIAKELTPDILVKFSHSEYFGIIDSVDIGSRHYPGWEGLMKYANYFRPIIFDEAVHINAYNTSETFTDPGLRDLWGDYLKYFVDNIYDSPAILGLAVWSGIDEIFYPLDQNPVGFGPWGVLDVFRREKPEYWHLKMAYSPVQLVSRCFQKNDNYTIVTIRNRYGITNLEDLKIVWSDGSEKGVLKCKGMPGMCTSLLIPHIMKTDSLKLSFFDRQGFEIFTCALTSLDQYNNIMPPLEKGICPILVDNNSHFEVLANDIKYVFSKSEGMLSKINIHSKDVLGNPELYLIPFGEANDAVDFIPQDNIAKNKSFLSECLKNWKLDTLYYDSDTSFVKIHSIGSYDSIPVHYTYIINSVGQIKINYKINFSSYNVENIRQIGLGFNLSADYDILKWKKDGIWTIYPDDHIGRNSGEANLFSNHNLEEIIKQRIFPQWPYSQDNSTYGTVDFRSTKYNLFSAFFLNKKGHGIKIESNGMQHLRSWYESPYIHFFVANYSNGGNEFYLSFDSNRTRISREEKLLDGGDFCGWIQLRFD